MGRENLLRNPDFFEMLLKSNWLKLIWCKCLRAVASLHAVSGYSIFRAAKTYKSFYLTIECAFFFWKAYLRVSLLLFDFWCIHLYWICYSCAVHIVSGLGRCYLDFSFSLQKCTLGLYVQGVNVNVVLSQKIKINKDMH